jgi:putative membrane protein
MRLTLNPFRPSVLAMLASLLSLEPLPAFAQAASSGSNYWPGPWHMWGWGFGWIFPMLMMVLLFAACFFFMTRMPFGHRHGHFGDTTDSALRILGERFAKGEISKEEFEEKKSILGRGS